MPSTLEVIAKQVEADIRNRGLRSGDKYLTGREVGRLLNVSSVTANRAMQQLAARGVLVRQRKAGTFVGEAVPAPSRSLRKRVHVLLTSGIGAQDGSASNGYMPQLLGGIVEAMPGVSVQTDIVGRQEANDIVVRIVEEYQASEVAGVILIRSSLEIQRRLAESGVPVVVFGSVYPGVQGLPSLDIDQCQIGTRTAEYVARSSHRRVLLLTLNQWAPGDNLFMNGFMDAMHALNPAVQFDLQSVPDDNETVFQVIKETLARSDRPTAIVARSPWLARTSAEVAKSVGARIPHEVELVLGNHHEVEIEGRRIPGAQAVESMLECSRRLGRMLLAQSTAHQGIAKRELISVEFAEQ
jgi:DNA-binding LacI/PurR family transcriptional regulator